MCLPVGHRRSSVTPHKTGPGSSSSSAVDQAGRIAELERRLVEREEEARDLQTKLFESSLAGRGKLRLCFGSK